MQGSVYQKTDATRDINVDSRNKYWADSEVGLPRNCAGGVILRKILQIIGLIAVAKVHKSQCLFLNECFSIALHSQLPYALHIQRLWPGCSVIKQH